MLSWRVSDLSCLWRWVSFSSKIQRGYFLLKVMLVPCLWMHKGWHLYCTDKAWHLYWYKAGHASVYGSLLFHKYFCCSLYSVIRVLSWETSKASKSFTFPPSDPLHIMFWLSRKIIFQHSLTGDWEILISVERFFIFFIFFSQVAWCTSGSIAFSLNAIVLLGK